MHTALLTTTTIKTEPLTPKIPPCPFVVSSSLLPQPLATTDLFSVPIVLPVPECHGNGLIQYVANGV